MLPKPTYQRSGVTLYQAESGDVLSALPERSVHCCVTSPPYWGLRDYGEDGQLGLESTPEEYVERMVGIFREVWRVLRDDGTVWLNLGDSYCADVRKGRAHMGGGKNSAHNVWHNRQPEGRKQKDLIGIPWLVAFALQRDGWYLRQDIIWHKPNPIPESVRDRCTKAHEYLFLLSKGPRYYYDAEAVKEEGTQRPCGNRPSGKHIDAAKVDPKHRTKANLYKIGPAEARNRRSVWTVTTKPYPGAHFATFPPDLVEPCILAGTSEHGCCPECGTPHRRKVSKRREATRPGNDSKVHGVTSVHEDSPYHDHKGMICGNRDPQRHTTVTTTAGWEPACSCMSGPPEPCVVLDPFVGSGTAMAVAAQHGRRGIGIDLSADYLKLATERIDPVLDSHALFEGATHAP